MLGAILALASAGFFGLNNATVRRGVLRASVMQAMAVTVPLGVPIFLGFAALMGGFEALRDWRLDAWVWMVAAGVIHFVVGRYGNYRATQTLGSTLSAPLQQASILVALLLGFIFLGESVNAINVIGILLVILGPMMLVRRRATVKATGAAKGFEPQIGPGLFWGAVAAFGYGTSPLFIALGLGEGATMADSVGGVLVSYTAAALVVIAIVVFAGGSTYLRGIENGSMRWFLMSTVAVALSQLFRYLALAVAPVAVVVPIQRLSVVFRLIFNAFINREHEVFDRWVILTILLSVLGAITLAMDTEMLLGFLNMPEALIRRLSQPLI